MPAAALSGQVYATRMLAVKGPLLWHAPALARLSAAQSGPTARSKCLWVRVLPQACAPQAVRRPGRQTHSPSLRALHRQAWAGLAAAAATGETPAMASPTSSKRTALGHVAGAGPHRYWVALLAATTKMHLCWTCWLVTPWRGFPWQPKGWTRQRLLQGRRVCLSRTS